MFLKQSDIYISNNALKHLKLPPLFIRKKYVLNVSQNTVAFKLLLPWKCFQTNVYETSSETIIRNM